MLTLPYRAHCRDFYDTDLIKVSGQYGSLYLDTVSFVEVRAQYDHLIHMNDSTNRTMLNTHFYKVQARPGWDYGVVFISYADDVECPLTGCEPILLDR